MENIMTLQSEFEMAKDNFLALLEKKNDTEENVYMRMENDLGSISLFKFSTLTTSEILSKQQEIRELKSRLFFENKLHELEAMERDLDKVLCNVVDKVSEYKPATLDELVWKAGVLKDWNPDDANRILLNDLKVLQAKEAITTAN